MENSRIFKTMKRQWSILTGLVALLLCSKENFKNSCSLLKGKTYQFYICRYPK
jgi:hypothetical protein